jgi:hypothetical protein
MNVEQLAEGEFAGKTEILEENSSKRHFVHQNSHLKTHGIDSGLKRWKADK